MRFYLNFRFVGFKVVNTRAMNLFKDFRILSGWIEKYKPALCKLNYSWDYSYCVRLVLVSLTVSIGKL